MKTRSHELLARYLLNQIPDGDSVISQKIFILGCIEPDLNIFSYLRGSLRYQKLRGHNYNSTRRYNLHVLKVLHRRKKWSLRDYYRLGKLMHYLADSFTYPHNDGYTGTLLEHRAYETVLHSCFAAYLGQCSQDNRKGYPEDIGKYIAEFHEKYMRSAGNVKNDAKFITQATSCVMGALVIGSAMVGNEKREAPYEDFDNNRLVCTNR